MELKIGITLTNNLNDHKFKDRSLKFLLYIFR